MQERIANAFRDKSRKLLSIFTTAGYPKRDDTLTVCQQLQDAGVDMIELGFPFSDPLADGPTIQRSSEIALAQGMSLELLFSQLKDLRPNIHIPVLLMGYLNPVLQYGVQRFCKSCQDVGIDGLILPDLPLDEYQNEYAKIFDAHGLKSVFLITPQTSPERIRKIDECTTGFIYVVSTASITGSKLQADEGRNLYFQRVHEMNLKNPLVVGFGIHDYHSFQQATTHTHGGIIGSAFLRALHDTQDLPHTIQEFVAQLRNPKPQESTT